MIIEPCCCFKKYAQTIPLNYPRIYIHSFLWQDPLFRTFDLLHSLSPFFTTAASSLLEYLSGLKHRRSRHEWQTQLYKLYWIGPQDGLAQFLLEIWKTSSQVICKEGSRRYESDSFWDLLWCDRSWYYSSWILISLIKLIPSQSNLSPMEWSWKFCILCWSCRNRKIEGEEWCSYVDLMMTRVLHAVTLLRVYPRSLRSHKMIHLTSWA